MRTVLTVLPIILLLWKPVYSITEFVRCCECVGLDLVEKPSDLKPSVLPSPFQITVSNDVYVAQGSTIDVNITSTDSTRQFKDFILQAVYIDQDGKVTDGNSVGLFTLKDGQTQYSTRSACGNRAILSDDQVAKSKIRFTWRNTDRTDRNVIFRATIVDDKEESYWLRELSRPVQEIRNKQRLIDVIDTSKCGTSKGCYRVPEGCWEPYCDYIVTWQHQGGRMYHIEMGAMTDGVTDRYVAMALSDDTKWGDDFVMLCAHNGTAAETKVYTGRSVDDHSFVLHDEPRAGIEGVNGFPEGHILGHRIRCRFQIIAARTEFPDGEVHVLVSRGASPNGVPQKHGHGVGEIPVATPDKVLLSDSTVNIGDYARFPLVKAHGILMILAWAFFGTTGLLWTKYYKTMWPNKRIYGERYWFVAHFNCMIMLVLLVVIAFIIIFVEVGGYSKADYLPYEAHPILGIIIFCCILLNPIIALLRPADDHRCRPVVNWIHWFFGTVAWCLAIPNMFIGMDFGKAMVPWWSTWILCIYILYHIIVEITLEVHQCCTHKKNKERRKKYEFQKRENPKARIPEPEPAGRVFKRNMLYVHFIITCIVNLIMLIAIAAS